MAEWLEQASQWHEMCCHDLEVMNSNPGRAELGVLSTSVLSRTWTKNIKCRPTSKPADLFADQGSGHFPFISAQGFGHRGLLSIIGSTCHESLNCHDDPQIIIQPICLLDPSYFSSNQHSVNQLKMLTVYVKCFELKWNKSCKNYSFTAYRTHFGS